MKALTIAALFASTILFAPAAFAQAAGPERPARITYLMSPKELEATGLRSLTSDQIDALSAWLQQYRASAEWLAVTAAQGEDLVQTDEMIESRIDGEFDGWVGDTIFRLKNGQIWQQVSPSARYMFARDPKVTISAAPHRLRVEGMAIEVVVRRLR